MVHIVLSQPQQNQNKKKLKPLFPVWIWFLLLATITICCTKKKLKNTNWAHWCFFGPWIGLASKAQKWCLRKKPIFCRFSRFLAVALLTLSFFFCPFVFEFSGFGFLFTSFFCLLLFHTSSSYVVVLLHVVLVVLLSFFSFGFVLFFCVCFLRVRRGGPKGHLTWP